MSNYGPSFPTGDGQQPGGQQPGQQPGGEKPGEYSNPYGASNPYGSSDPYGGAYPGGGYQGGGYPGGVQQPQKTDGVSITGFVLSLTCCLSIVGAILGFVGLSRTKNNQRKGRWAAISAVIIGIIGTLAAASVSFFVYLAVVNSISVEEAEVGQCANVEEVDTNTFSFQKRECDESHDAEIVYVGEVSEAQDANVMPSNVDDFTDAGVAALICSALMDPSDIAKIDEVGNLEFGIITIDPDDPNDDDPFFCFVEDGSGDKLDSPILD